MQVRDYELDQFGVVNNAVYSSYLQHGRHEALSALGTDVDAYARQGTPLALSSLSISFRAPLRSRDVFRVTVSAARVTPARLVLQQRIVRTRSGAAPAAEEDREELVVDAEAVVVFLDSSYRAARVPQGVAKLFKALQQMREEHQQEQQQHQTD
ncbi:hypothetical protein GPECTOR_90g537 [Gonium pectorale]|uniref:Uncharacterized protein n=1 Tax=Gonium pectorale TaxID=33097 RepID=A0A150G2B7_GONPE|nr:hypothetical protein GPECTOR_90g537 [Gonium pectorale]|eukprot:KXZ43450.1 hypothetical protein GPECTOR_90g537 [Gonium pectorale]